MEGSMNQEPSRIVFEDVVEELSEPLRRYLERLVGNRATADDLLQETLLKIARALPNSAWYLTSTFLSTRNAAFVAKATAR